MAESHDISLPLASEHVQADSSWPVEQRPTTLICLWPGGQPVQLEILAGLSSALNARLEPIEDLPATDPAVAWATIVQPDESRSPWIVWCEPAKKLPPGELSNSQAERCRWVVGVETMLDRNDPVDHFMFIMRTLVRGLPDVRGIIDPNTTHFHSAEHLRENFGDDAIDPPAEIMWTIHMVSKSNTDGQTNPDDVAWLHTHGLWQCGVPELEMLEVPMAHAQSAAGLLNSIAELLLESPPPPAGDPFEVGGGVFVTLQPWQKAAAEIDPHSCGGLADRSGDAEPEHAGVRAVICEAFPTHNSKERCSWPKSAVIALQNDEATLFRTNRATQRQAAIAQATWPDLATAFASIERRRHSKNGAPSAVVLLKAGFATHASNDRDGNSREHLWFEIDRFESDRAYGKLINTPCAVPDLHAGDKTWLQRSEVSDWQVMSPRGTFGPHRIASLWRMIDELNGSS